jgi:hypothetical protein
VWRVVVQDANRSIPRRVKPWGTVHAVVAARHLLDGPFAVVNADDLYGSEATQLLMDVMTAARLPTTWSAIGGSGRSHRNAPPTAPCSYYGAGRLTALVEMRGLTPEWLDPEAVVSMNLWGFGRGTMARLEADPAAFVAAHGGDANAELALPEAVSARPFFGPPVFVHITEQEWTGNTYSDDVEWARERVGELAQSGRCPERLSGGARE